STSARSAPATSTPSRRWSPPARPRPPRCTARPRTSSSSTRRSARGSPPPEAGLPCAAFQRRVHRPPVVQVEPALHDAVDKPDAHGNAEKPSDDDDQEDAADDIPEQGKPEGPDLPAEVRLQQGACDLLPLDVVDDDSHHACYSTRDKRQA